MGIRNITDPVDVAPLLALLVNNAGPLPDVADIEPQRYRFAATAIGGMLHVSLTDDMGIFTDQSFTLTMTNDNGVR